MHVASAILAVNSLDRYTVNATQDIRNPNFDPTQPISPSNPEFITVTGIFPQDIALNSLYEGRRPNGNSFTLNYPGALIYGYIKTIAISQVQIEYKIPTVVPTTDFNNPNTITSGNDSFYIYNVTRDILQLITIPYGFYTPDELASVLTVLLQTVYEVGNPEFTVTYANAGGNNFEFASNNLEEFFFPDRDDIDQYLPPGVFITDIQWFNVLRAYRLLGVTIANAAPFDAHKCWSPNFLYTPYIDICSQNLTKYQKIRDTDTSVNKRQSILARIYLSGVGAPVSTSDIYALGSQPFVMTADLNTPKIVKWNPDEAVYELDFQLYDAYGYLIFWKNIYSTEFQMTLICSEGND